MLSSFSSLQQTAGSYLQKADTWVAAKFPNRLILAGCSLGTALLVVKKLPVAELLSRPIHSLEKRQPNLAKKISWIVPVGGIALSAAATSAILGATSSPIPRALAWGIHAGITAQLLQNKGKVISLGKLFRSWSGVDEFHSEALNRVATAIVGIAAFTLAILCHKLGSWNLLTCTLICMTMPAVHTLTLKIAQYWNGRSE